MPAIKQSNYKYPQRRECALNMRHPEFGMPHVSKKNSIAAWLGTLGPNRERFGLPPLDTVFGFLLGGSFQ